MWGMTRMTAMSLRTKLRTSFVRGSLATMSELPGKTVLAHDPLGHEITCHPHHKCKGTSFKKRALAAIS